MGWGGRGQGGHAAAGAAAYPCCVQRWPCAIPGIAACSYRVCSYSVCVYAEEKGPGTTAQKGGRPADRPRGGGARPPPHPPPPRRPPRMRRAAVRARARSLHTYHADAGGAREGGGEVVSARAGQRMAPHSSRNAGVGRRHRPALAAMWMGNSTQRCFSRAKKPSAALQYGMHGGMVSLL